MTTLSRPRIPCTKTRLPATATDPYPAPISAADQTSAGPVFGHCFSRPVSRDTPDRSGPRHCGHSPAAGA